MHLMLFVKLLRCKLETLFYQEKIILQWVFKKKLHLDSLPVYDEMQVYYYFFVNLFFHVTYNFSTSVLKFKGKSFKVSYYYGCF